MIQRSIGWVLSLAMRQGDDSIAEAELHTFMRDGLQELTTSVRSGNLLRENPLVKDIFLAAERLHVLGVSGFAAIEEGLIPQVAEVVEPDSEEALPVISQGRIVSNVVDALLATLGADGSVDSWQATQMEALLRRIEIRRRSALQFEPSLSAHERRVAIQNISLLFTRFALIQHDYRFLNTALKLNDWSFKDYRSMIIGIGGLEYLRAVIEAEATLLEMTT